MVLLLEGLDLSLSLFCLAYPDLVGVLCIFEIFSVVVVLDDFSLDVLLGVAILSLVLLVEKTQLSHRFLQITQLLLGLFYSQLNIC